MSIEESEFFKYCLQMNFKKIHENLDSEIVGEHKFGNAFSHDAFLNLHNRFIYKNCTRGKLLFYTIAFDAVDHRYRNKVVNMYIKLYRALIEKYWTTLEHYEQWVLLTIIHYKLVRSGTFKDLLDDIITKYGKPPNPTLTSHEHYNHVWFDSFLHYRDCRDHVKKIHKAKVKKFIAKLVGGVLVKRYVNRFKERYYSCGGTYYMITKRTIGHHFGDNNKRICI